MAHSHVSMGPRAGLCAGHPAPASPGPRVQGGPSTLRKAAWSDPPNLGDRTPLWAGSFQFCLLLPIFPFRNRFLRLHLRAQI